MSAIAKERPQVSERDWFPLLFIVMVLGLLGVVSYFWIFQARLPFSNEPVRTVFPEVYLPPRVHVIKPPAIGSPTRFLPDPKQARVVEASSLADYRRVADDLEATNFLWVIGNNIEYRTVYREKSQEWLYRYTHSGSWHRRPTVPRWFLGEYYPISAGELGPQVVDNQLVLHWVYRQPTLGMRLLGSGLAFWAWMFLFGVVWAFGSDIHDWFAG